MDLLCILPLAIGYETLSLHDALPIWTQHGDELQVTEFVASEKGVDALDVLRYGTGEHGEDVEGSAENIERDRKSTRLNSSHVSISYAVFCLKKKKQLDPRCINIRADK